MFPSLPLSSDDRSQKKPIYKASVESLPSTCGDKQPLVWLHTQVEGWGGGGWKKMDREPKKMESGQKMRDGIEKILKEGGDGVGLWMVTLGEERRGKGGRQRGIFGGARESKIKIKKIKAWRACDCFRDTEAAMLVGVLCSYASWTKGGQFLLIYSAVWKMVSYIFKQNVEGWVLCTARAVKAPHAILSFSVANVIAQLCILLCAVWVIAQGFPFNLFYKGGPAQSICEKVIIISLLW